MSLLVAIHADVFAIDALMVGTADAAFELLDFGEDGLDTDKIFNHDKFFKR